jgi:hypothetical protein
LEVERARQLVKRKEAMCPPADEYQVTEIWAQCSHNSGECGTIFAEFRQSTLQQPGLQDTVPDVLCLFFATGRVVADVEPALKNVRASDAVFPNGSAKDCFRILRLSQEHVHTFPRVGSDEA